MTGGFVNQDVTATIHNLTIDKGAELIIPDDIQLRVDGKSITVKGQLFLNNTAGFKAATRLYIGGSTVKLSGSGWVTMSDSPANYITGGMGNTFINQLSSSQGIQGAGNIGDFELNLQNFGTIDANAQKNSLDIAPLGKMVNAKILEGTSGQLRLRGGEIANTNAGSIQGSVLLLRAIISGGTLGPGVIVAKRPLHGSGPTLDGVTLAVGCQYQVIFGALTILKGTITNEGTISLMGTQNSPASLVIDTAVTLTGGGSTTINGPNDSIAGSGFLVNDQHIQGLGGSISVAKLQNTTTISAAVSNDTVIVQVRHGDNTGGLFDTNGGILDFKAGEVTGGTASSDNEIFYDDGVALRAMAWGGAGVHVPHNATVEGGWKNLSNVQLSNDDLLEASGLLDNEGAIDLGGGPRPAGPATLLISGTANLTGKGTVTMSGTGLNNAIMGKTGSDTLTNSSTIQGTGIIGNNSMNLVNAGKGVINANSSLPLDISMGAGNLFTNKGSLLVAAIVGQSPSLLTLTGPFANFNSNTATLTGGIYNIAGTFQFDNANIVSNAANIILAGQIVNQNNVNGLANFATNSSSGRFTLLPQNFGQFRTAGTFTNQGQLSIAKGSQFIVGGTGNYEQAGGKTTVDGMLAVPTGSLVDATAGTLAGDGTFSGNVSVGNASGAGPVSGKSPYTLTDTRRVPTKVRASQPAGAVATFIIGDSLSQAGLVSVTNDYTQLLTGVLDVQIGGTAAGSQYSQLNVTSTVSLGGTLNIKRIKGFVPNIGDTFTILTGSAVSGQFATVNGRSINSSEHFQVNYGATSVMLQVVQGPIGRRPAN
jgi:hypothetical protein